MNEDLLKFINDRSKEDDLVNRLYGIRMNEGSIQGLILDKDDPRFWLPQHKLCSFHANLIDKWIELGGEVE